MTDESKEVRSSEEILVRCITDYEAQDVGELSLSVGDVVRVTERTDANWWKGVKEATNEEGGFPVNVVERASESGGEVPEKLENEAEETKEPEAPKLATIEYDYEARDSDELSLRKGSVITVLEQYGGWWKGDLNGRIGVFPANHVKLIEVPTGSGDTSEQGEQYDDKDKIIHRIAAYGVKTGGIGGLFSGGIPSLKKTKRGSEDSKDAHKAEERSVPAVEFKLRRAGSRSTDSTESDQGKKEKLASPPVVPTQHNRPSNIDKGIMKPPKGRPPKIVRKARVLYEYEAEAEDEISLQEGTIVVILEKMEEDGWWKGRNEQNSVGIFPSTYVQELKFEDEHSTSLSSDAHQDMAIDNKVTDPISKDMPEDEGDVDAIQREPELAPVSPGATKSPSQAIMEDVASSHSSMPKDIASMQPSEDTQPSPTGSPKRPPSLPERSPSHDSYAAQHEGIPQRRSTYDLTSSPITQKRASKDLSTSRPSSLVSPDLPPITQKRASKDLSTSRPSSLVSPDLPPIPPARRSSKSPPPPPIRQPPHPTSILMENTDEINDSKITAERLPMPPPKLSSQPQSSVDRKAGSSRPPPALAKPPPVPRMAMAKSSLARKPSLHEDGRETTAGPTSAVPPRPRQQTDLTEVQLVKPPKPPSPNADIHDTELDRDAYSSENDQKFNIHEQVMEKTKEEIAKEEEIFESKSQRRATANINVESKGKQQTFTEQESTDMDDEDFDKQAPEQKEPSPNKSDSPLLQDQPAMKSKKVSSQTNVLDEDQANAELTSQSTDSAPTMPPKPSKPLKPSFVKLPIAAGGSGGVKSLSNRFNQFGGIPDQSSDVELRLKRLMNEELSKIKMDFSNKLAQERQAREALETEVDKLKRKLEEMGI